MAGGNEVVETCRSLTAGSEPIGLPGHVQRTESRDVERELFPCLNKAMASGSMPDQPACGRYADGKHLSMDDIPDSGRFTRSERGYLDRYWKPGFISRYVAGTSKQLQRLNCFLEQIPVQVAMSWSRESLFARLGTGSTVSFSAPAQPGTWQQNYGGLQPCGTESTEITRHILDLRLGDQPGLNCFRYFRP